MKFISFLTVFQSLYGSSAGPKRYLSLTDTEPIAINLVDFSRIDFVRAFLTVLFSQINGKSKILNTCCLVNLLNLSFKTDNFSINAKHLKQYLTHYQTTKFYTGPN